MGNQCGPGTNQFGADYFIQKYGEQVILNFAKQNIQRQQILKHLPEITQSYRNKIHAAKIKSISQLNILEAKLNNQIQTKIKQVEKQNDGQVTKAQQDHNKCAEEIMGRQEIKKDCTNLRRKITQTYEEEQKKNTQNIKANFQRQVQKIEKQRNSLFPQVSQMNQQQQESVRKQMKRKFKKQIKQYRRKISEDIKKGDYIGFGDQQNDFKKLHPKQEIQKIKKKGEALIAEGQDIIRGKNIFGQSSRQIIPPVGCFRC